MKYLDTQLSVKEFNNLLKEGMKTGIIITTNDDLNFMIELAYNLDHYLTFFMTQYGKENNI